MAFAKAVRQHGLVPVRRLEVRNGSIQLTSLRLLIIDASSRLASDIGWLSAQHRVDVVAHDDALARLTAEQLDCAILDYDLRDRTGLAMLAGIGRLADAPPVICVISRDDSAMAVAAIKAGAADVLVKSQQDGFSDRLAAAILAAVEVRTHKDHNGSVENADPAARNSFEALVAEQQALMRQVNHRVGNSLQVVAAFLHFQAASSPPEAKAVLTEANRRVLAVAELHHKLVASERADVVALHRYLGTLVDHIEKTAAGDGTGPALRLDAEEMEIDPDDAVTLGLVMTEVLNQVLQEIPSGKAGPVHIILKRLDLRRSVLAVAEEGPSRPERAATAAGGTGAFILRTMLSKLGATLDVHADAAGRQTTVTFPTRR